MDKLIKEYAAKLEAIYVDRTAGVGTFSGLLAEFQRKARIEELAKWRDALDNETERLAD